MALARSECVVITVLMSDNGMAKGSLDQMIGYEKLGERQGMADAGLIVFIDDPSQLGMIAKMMGFRDQAPEQIFNCTGAPFVDVAHDIEDIHRLAVHISR